MSTTDPTTLNRRRALARKVRALMGEGLPDSHRAVSQTQLGEIIGVGQRGVSERLNGKTAFTADELFAIMEAFDKDASHLIPAPSDLGFDTSGWISGGQEDGIHRDLIAIP